MGHRVADKCFYPFKVKKYLWASIVVIRIVILLSSRINYSLNLYSTLLPLIKAYEQTALNISKFLWVVYSWLFEFYLVKIQNLSDDNVPVVRWLVKANLPFSHEIITSVTSLAFLTWMYDDSLQTVLFANQKARVYRFWSSDNQQISGWLTYLWSHDWFSHLSSRQTVTLYIRLFPTNKRFKYCLCRLKHKLIVIYINYFVLSPTYCIGATTQS